MTKKIKEHNAEYYSTLPSSLEASHGCSQKKFISKKGKNNSRDEDHEKTNHLFKLDVAAISTLVIAIWTVVYSVIAGLQLWEIRREAEVSQRAYLSAITPETIGGGFGLLRIQIENYGQVPANWFELHMNYMFIETNFTTGVLKYLDNRTIDIRENKPIYPGNNNHQITIIIPRKGNAPNKLTTNQSILIRARITYDTGFGNTDTLTICEGFAGGKTKWESCGGLSTSIDLEDAKVIQNK